MWKEKVDILVDFASLEMNGKKTTNREQFAKLVAVMRENEDVARNMTKRSPESLKTFWLSLKADLDSLGPPVKEMSEWKKVWSDYKSAVRKKLSAQIREVKSTGGGPNKKILLTPLEDEVADLLNVRSSMSGLPTSSCFGVPKGLHNNSMVLDERTDDVIDPNTQEVAFREENNNSIEILNGGLPTTPVLSSTPMEEENRGRKRRLIATDERVDDLKGKTIRLLEQQTTVQQKFGAELIPLLEEASTSMKDIKRIVEKIYREKKTQTDIMQAQLKETLRHNKEMEKIAMKKAIVKQQILELQLKSLEKDMEE